MRSNKILAIAVVVLLLSNIALIAFVLKGKEKRTTGPFGGKDPFTVMVEELKMTDQQQTEYKQLREQHFQKVKPLFDSMRAAKSSLYALIKEDDSKVNHSLLNIYSNKIGERQSELDRLMFEHFRNVRKLFTAEQQPKFDSLVQRMMQRGKKDSSKRKSSRQE